MKNLKLAKAMLKETINIELNHVSYKKEKDQIIVWSNDSPQGVFHGKNLVVLFSDLFNVMFKYNSEMNRVEMIVF